MIIFSRLILLMSLLLVTGCSLTPASDPITTLTLKATPTINSQITPLNMSLRINKPNASGYLASARILVMTDKHQLSLYKGAQWNETTPLLIRNHLMDSFRQTNVISFISTDDKRIAASVELDSDLRAFQLEYQQGKPVILIKLVVRLIDANQKRIIANQTFTQSIDASSSELNSVVDAFAHAQNSLSQSVVVWTQQVLSQAL